MSGAITSSSLLADFKVVEEDAGVFVAGEYKCEVVEDIVLKARTFHIPADAGLYGTKFILN